MNLDFGSSAILVAAAALWFFYLVPTWLRRREYLATERNAVRLQQTLRIMAETAEVPRQVRAETTARSVAAQQRVLKKEHQVADAIARAQDAAAVRAAERRLAQARLEIAAAAESEGLAQEAAFAKAAESSVRGASAPSVATMASRHPASGIVARRLRRSRALTSLVLVAALIAVGFGVPLLVSGSWVLLAVGSAVAVGAIALLSKMAAVARSRVELARSARVRRVQAPRVAPSMPVVEDAPAHQPWTPVPLPKPLYLQGSAPRTAVASHPSIGVEARRDRLDDVETHERVLREAAAQAERALRAAQDSPNVTPIIRPAAVPTPAPVPSRFASMGILDGADAGVTDLDAVLRRRRAVG